MSINAGKTEVMHICEQGRMPAATAAECTKVAKHKCPHIGCNKVFFNTHGCKVHAGKCKRGKLYVVDRILAVRGETASPKREFLVRWEGYSSDHDSWQPRNNLPPLVVNEFLKSNDLYDYDWGGGRCPHCDRPCKSSHGVKIHAKSCWQRPTEQNFTGTCAEEKVRQNHLADAQEELPHLQCAS